MEKLKEDAQHKLTEEKNRLKENENEYDRLHKIVNSKDVPAACQTLDYLHRQLVQTYALSKGFPAAEARCAALKSAEQKACAGKPESEWLKTTEKLRAEEAKLEVQRHDTAEAQGRLDGFEEAVKNATEANFEAVPITARLKVRAKEQVSAVQKALIAVNSEDAPLKVAESNLQSTKATEAKKRSVYEAKTESELKAEAGQKRAQKELDEKLKERNDKAEIKTKLAQAEKEWKERVKNLRLVYQEAQDNVTALTAAALNAADLAASAKTHIYQTTQLRKRDTWRQLNMRPAMLKIVP